MGVVEGIPALQGVDDSTGSRSRGVRYGQQQLELLDEVRAGMLAGGLTRVTLNRLAQVASDHREEFADPKLQNVLDEIKLRARV